MNQRILSCPSTLIRKGVTMKAGDWTSQDASASVQTGVDLPRPPSSMSLPNNSWKLAASSSSASLKQQLDMHRLSSSNFASIKKDGSFNSFKNQPNPAQGNATWGEVAVAPNDSKHGYSFLNFAPLSADTSSTSRPPNMFLDGTYVNKLDSSRRRKPLSNLGLLREEDDALRCSSSSFRILQQEDDVDGRRQNEYTSHSIVKTFNDESPKKIDLRDLSSSDLTELKTSDPFLYYSVPTVKEAEANGQPVDLESLRDEVLGSRSTIERKSRISVETWNIDFIGLDHKEFPTLADSYYDMDMDDDENSDSEQEDLYSYLGSLQ